MFSFLVPDENGRPDIERMMRKHGNEVLHICYIYLRDNKLSEDAMQDTFIKVYKKYDSYDGKSSEKTWIIRIAINVCRDYLKKAWLRKIVVGIEPKHGLFEGYPENSLEEHVFSSEANKELMGVVSSLKPKYKEVILLHYYQKYSTGEIVKLLKIPEGTVCIRLKRGRERLKKLLADSSYWNESNN